MANRNFASSKMFTGHVMPILLDCNFVVDSTNGNGLGIRSLKGPYVQNVFMFTSSSPGKGNSNNQTPNMSITNPNPAAGTIVVQFQDNFSRSYTGGNAIAAPVSASGITPTGTNLTVGVAYIITALGAMTAADWIALGVPAGVTPTVGTSFIAAAQGAASGGSSQVRIAFATGSTVATIETFGDPNASISPNILKQGFGAQIILQCRDYAGALVAPHDGSVISLSFLLSNSSVLIQGE